MNSHLLDEELNGDFKQYCEIYNVSDSKIALENFIRRELFNLHERSQSFATIEKYLELCFTLADESKIDNSIPFLLIEDIVEIASFELLCQLLPYLDRKAYEWCSKLSSKKGNGLILLRTVNLMRRRIIRSEHSKLAGLALLLLSKIFPVNERSGLNLKGEPNDQNMLFWKLHELLYLVPQDVNDIFKPMQKSIDYILEIIETVLEDEYRTHDVEQSTDFDFFSPQFLTENDNFSKQISDANFRLSVLTQILIALQDLIVRSSIEFSKSSKAELYLDNSQIEWINESSRKAFMLVSRHQNGRDHFRFLRHVIRSEKNWLKWKSLSCPDFDTGSNSQNFVCRSVQSPAPSALVNLGNDELKRLWSYDSSSVSDRQLRPGVSEYLERYVNEDGDENSLNVNAKWRVERLKWKARF